MEQQGHALLHGAHRRKRRRTGEAGQRRFRTEIHRPQSQFRCLSAGSPLCVESGQLWPDLDSPSGNGRCADGRQPAPVPADYRNVRRQRPACGRRREDLHQRRTDRHLYFPDELLLDDGRQPPQFGGLPLLGIRSRRPHRRQSLLHLAVAGSRKELPREHPLEQDVHQSQRKQG